MHTLRAVRAFHLHVTRSPYRTGSALSRFRSAISMPRIGVHMHAKCIIVVHVSVQIIIIITRSGCIILEPWPRLAAGHNPRGRKRNVFGADRRVNGRSDVRTS